MSDVPAPEPPRARRSRAELACALVLALVTLAGRLWVGLADPDTAMASDFLQDDAFYYLVIADHVAQGHGMTFDGTVATNGFSPLYMLALVPLRWMVGADPLARLRAAGVLAAVVALCAGIALERLGRRVGGPWAGVALLGLWALSPSFLAHSANGMDTGSAALCALVLLLAYLRCARAQAPPSLARALALGAAGGLALLARIDLGFLGAALALDWVVGALRRRALAAALPRMAVAGATALAVWACWGVASQRATGRWTPQSGPAGREIALQYGWAHLQPVWTPPPAQPFFDVEDVPPAWHADVATRFLSVFLFEHPLLSAFRLDQPFTFWADAGSSRLLGWFRADPPGRAARLAALLALVLLACLPWRRARGADPRLGGIAALTFLLTLAGYTFLAPVHWFFARYLVPLVLVTTVAAVGALARALGRLPRAPRRALGTALALLAWAGVATGYRPAEGQPYATLARGGAPPNGFVSAWRRMAPRVAADQRIGAFQAGALAYFSGRPVVNLDGKVNPDAQRALHAGAIGPYLLERGVDLVFDWQWIVYALCARRLGPDAPLRLELVQEPGTPLEPAVFAVRPRSG